MNATDILPYVLAAARRNWQVFPVAAGDKEPVRGWRWKEHTTTDPATIQRYWGRCGGNYGIATGPSGLLVVDLDIPKPGDPAPPPAWDQPGITDGADVFTELARQAGAISDPAAYAATFDTFTVRTRRGGTHLYYAAPPGIVLGNTSGDRGTGLGWKIDTRGQGGYVVGPGCYVADEDGAGSYTVTNPAPVAPLPAWLAALLAPKPEPAAADPARLRTRLASAGDAAGYGLAALRAEVDTVLAAPRGTRNHTLNAAAFALGQLVGGGVLTRQLVTDALTEAGQAAGLGQRECETTVRSGLQAGLREPRGGAA